MGIFRTTLLHEAVHAAQSCKTGEFQPIGWKLEVDKGRNILILFIQAIFNRKFDIEREAFFDAGSKRCSKKNYHSIRKGLLDSQSQLSELIKNMNQMILYNPSW